MADTKGSLLARPADMREARVLTFFQRQDDWFQLRFWPRWAQFKILKAHKKRDDRYALMFFMLWNGLDPETAVNWN